MNNLNDLPGVQARAILRPGSEPGTTKIDIEVQKRKMWNNYIFADNGGQRILGPPRYRFGFNTEINNPTRTAIKSSSAACSPTKTRTTTASATSCP